MLAHVTVAVNVRGEHRGELLHRLWTVSALDCRGSVCQRLRLRRQRSDGHHSRIVLHRVAPGRYAGAGRFFIALRCLGRTYRQGAVARYRITLAVAAWTAVEDVRFARRITATYSNPMRIDRTPCPLGPSHDAARYSGHALAPVPAPPLASFSSSPSAAPETIAFTDTSRPGGGGAAIVSRLWNFGDPASGSADTSRVADPVHRFTAAGNYQVSLTVTDANGLSASVVQTVAVKGSPSSSAPGRRLQPQGPDDLSKPTGQLRR
jgi:hypothetical protein